MPRLLPCACVLALVLAPAARASGAPVSRAQVLEAIRAFERSSPANLAPSSAPANAASAVAAASRLITRFATESDEVLVDTGPDSMSWCDARRGLSSLPRSGERGLLVVAYLCGSLKAQLASGRPDPDPLPGWTEMLSAYRALRIQGADRIAEVDALLAHEADGTLGSAAAAALARSRDRLRHTYGAAQAPQGPLVTASQP